MNFRSYLEQDLRLVLLLLLREAGGKANESVLRSGAAGLGHARVTRDELREELDWLKERGLVAVEWFDDKVQVAEITERGLDVAEGRTAVDGVKKPSIARGS